MRIVTAIDSFKGSLTSLQAGQAVREAALRRWPEAEVAVRPLADGGEGTVEALREGLGGQAVTVSVCGPLGTPVAADYTLLPDGTAVLEMAAAAGITLISPEERDPLKTTTYGVGEMIRDALRRGCRRFIVGIGGSATNDGGAGMLQALGFALLDADGVPIPWGARGLERLCRIEPTGAAPELRECTFRVACDVTNPLCGEQGCSAVFAPQKGGTPETIPQMDEWLSHYALLAAEVSATADPEFPGVGAAGGLGFAFRAFLPAVLESGVRIILEETRLEEYVRQADLVITGEGRLDAQTVMGKAPIGVATLAKRYGKRVLAFSGCVTSEAGVCNDHGIDAFFPILRGITTLEEALAPANAYANLVETAYQVFRLLPDTKGVEENADTNGDF